MAESIIDFRSDTVTRPTPAMRQAMNEAVVGDDVLGDDPTVLALQDKVAALLGKEAACFVPSGTMANQLAIKAQTEPGDEVICHGDSHIIHYETGAPAALSGVMISPLSGALGQFEAQDVEQAVRPYSSSFSTTKMLLIENTHNKGGGSVWPMDKLERVVAVGRRHKLRVHLDGARIWNACAASGLSPADYARPFDTIACCFSKGLGAPVGSAIVGDRATITRAHRFRKMFGGAMRQVGILAAAAIYALDHHRERLAEDHEHARVLADALTAVAGLKLVFPVETNMVFVDLSAPLPDAATVCANLKPHGILAMPMGSRRIRLVTHLDITRPMVTRACGVLTGVLRG